MSAGGYGMGHGGPPGGYGPPPGGGYGGPPGGGYGPPPGGGYGGPPGGGHGGPPGGGYGGPPGGGYGGPPGGGYGGPPGGGYGAPPGGGYGGPGGGFGAPAGGFGGMAMGFGGGSGVEFGAKENAVMAATASWAKGLAIVGFVQSGFQVLNMNVIGAIVSVCIAVAFLKGATSLRSVTQTQGNDIHHLITALGQFGSAFMIRIVMTCIGLGLVLIICAILAIVAIANA